MNVLVTKLPSDGHQKEPSGEVVVNICGILNNLVAGSSLAARDITFFDGLPKLFAIKSSHNSRLVNLVSQCSWFLLFIVSAFYFQFPVWLLLFDYVFLLL